MNERLRTIPADPAALPFPNASAWGSLIVTGGHVGVLHPLAPDVETQAEQAMSQLAQTLKEAGSSLDHVLRIDCFLASRSQFAAWNDVYRRFFPSRRPPRTTLVCGFALDGLLIEVQAIAVAASQ
jgi:2-iminobutanoate/2-iminopropanoate deaminase